MLPARQQKLKSPILAYAGYLFQTFLKRPFGYVVAVLYLVYLAVILLIVPASLHFEPLFIWNLGGFNMPIFNLFFIAASAASIAVAVFRTGRDDGTDLTLSAKPLTKTITVGVKTSVYLIIMAVISTISLIIVALVMPIFGKYDPITHITGILPSKYSGLLLSVFIGNLVNMLFFGGIAVFISMVGGQVITIVLNVVIVFVMCIMNFLYPQVTSSAVDVLSDKYNTEILSTSCNTLNQYNNPQNGTKQFKYATIQCTTDDEGTEGIHFDTKEYWDKASRESGSSAVNYIDIGKQLSNLYSSFGLDNARVQEAAKLFIGAHASIKYNINSATHVDDPDNVDAGNYPICYYGMKEEQGKTFPLVYVLGSEMEVSTENWYVLSTLLGYEFSSAVVITNNDSTYMNNSILKSTYQKLWFRLNELIFDEADRNLSRTIYDAAVTAYNPDGNFSEQTLTQINNMDPLPADHNEKARRVAKHLLAWTTFAMQDQIDEIASTVTGSSFPFKSKVINDWYASHGQDKKNIFNRHLFTSGIKIEDVSSQTKSYVRLVSTRLSYAETYANLYQYNVSNFYSISSIIAIWTIISCCLFTGSVIVYRRTDFK